MFDLKQKRIKEFKKLWKKNDTFKIDFAQTTNNHDATSDLKYVIYGKPEINLD